MPVRRTSIEIYNRMTRDGLLSKKRKQVYDVIYNGIELTGSQVSKRYKLLYLTTSHSETVRNRITELVQQGVVYEVREGDCPITGNTVTFYSTTDNLPTKIIIGKTKKQKIKEALLLIEALAKNVDKDVLDEVRTIYKQVRSI